VENTPLPGFTATMPELTHVEEDEFCASDKISGGESCGTLAASGVENTAGELYGPHPARLQAATVAT